MAGFNGGPYNNYQPYMIPQVPAQSYYGTSTVNTYPQQAVQQFVYVHGIEGANAYQLPQGVTKQLLWDDEKDSFYIKALDEYGRPKVVAWNDFIPHVEDKPAATSQQNIDFSVYPTKRDLEDFLARYDTSNYLTKKEFEEGLSHLSLGAGGRIVKDEFNA